MIKKKKVVEYVSGYKSDFKAPTETKRREKQPKMIKIIEREREMTKRTSDPVIKK